jgi:hypothetical protein
MARIAHECVPAGSATRVAAGFLDLLDAAEEPKRLESRLIARQAARLQALSFVLEMELQFLAQI